MDQLSTTTLLIGAGIVLVLSFLGGQIFSRFLGKSARAKAEVIVQEARETAREIELEAKNTAIRIKEDAEGEIAGWGYRRWASGGVSCPEVQGDPIC